MEKCEKYFTSYTGCKVAFDKYNNYHNLNGPAFLWTSDEKEYFIKDKKYDNFIEYIRAIINYKKDNK